MASLPVKSPGRYCRPGPHCLSGVFLFVFRLQIALFLFFFPLPGGDCHLLCNLRPVVRNLRHRTVPSLQVAVGEVFLLSDIRPVERVRPEVDQSYCSEPISRMKPPWMAGSITVSISTSWRLYFFCKNEVNLESCSSSGGVTHRRMA